MTRFEQMLHHLKLDDAQTHAIAGGRLTVKPFASKCNATYYELGIDHQKACVTISMIFVAVESRSGPMHQGPKYGERMLTQICAAADKFGVKLCLIASSNEKQTERLITWYQRHQFRLEPLGVCQLMVRDAFNPFRNVC